MTARRLLRKDAPKKSPLFSVPSPKKPLPVKASPAKKKLF
jgi:hypothetical protein